MRFAARMILATTSLYMLGAVPALARQHEVRVECNTSLPLCMVSSLDQIYIHPGSTLSWWIDANCVFDNGTNTCSDVCSVTVFGSGLPGFPWVGTVNGPSGGSTGFTPPFTQPGSYGYSIDCGATTTGTIIVLPDLNQDLATWPLIGEPGDQPTSPAGSNANSVAPLELSRGAGLSAAPGANSFNAVGWHDLQADDFISFGITAPTFQAVDLDHLRFAVRSSDDGPGFLVLRSSLDGFTSNLATPVTFGTNYQATEVDLRHLGRLEGLIEFRLYAQNSIAADGGNIAPGGSLRIEEYFDGSALHPVRVHGRIVPPSPFVEAFCFGDGSGQLCPCGNYGFLGEGCANSAGMGARLTVSGSSFLDLVMTGSQLPPGTPGLYFTASNPLNAGLGLSFGDGLRCISGSIVRLSVKNSDASGLSSMTLTLGPAPPGTTRYIQLWYRDPLGPCGTGFNLTNAVALMPWFQ